MNKTVYAEVDEALTIIATSDKKRKVMTNGKHYQARTLLDLPLEMPVPFIHPTTPSKSEEVTELHFSLQNHLDQLNASKAESEEWSLI